MSEAYSDAFGGKCGHTIQDGCLFLNSHVTNLRLMSYSADNTCVVTLDAGYSKARYSPGHPQIIFPVASTLPSATFMHSPSIIPSPSQFNLWRSIFGIVGTDRWSWHSTIFKNKQINKQKKTWGGICTTSTSITLHEIIFYLKLITYFKLYEVLLHPVFTINTGLHTRVLLLELSMHLE